MYKSKMHAKRVGGGFAVCGGHHGSSVASSSAAGDLPQAAAAAMPHFLEELLLRAPAPHSPTPSITRPHCTSVYNPCVSFAQGLQMPAESAAMCHKTATPRDSPRMPRGSPRKCASRGVAVGVVGTGDGASGVMDDPFALHGREIQIVPAPSRSGLPRSEEPLALPWSSPMPSERQKRAVATLAVADGAALGVARVPFPSLRHARHLATITPQHVDRQPGARQPPANRDESAVHRMSTESIRHRRHDERLERLYTAKAAYAPSVSETATFSAWTRCS